MQRISFLSSFTHKRRWQASLLIILLSPCFPYPDGIRFLGGVCLLISSVWWAEFRNQESEEWEEELVFHTGEDVVVANFNKRSRAFIFTMTGVSVVLFIARMSSLAILAHKLNLVMCLSWLALSCIFHDALRNKFQKEIHHLRVPFQDG